MRARISKVLMALTAIAALAFGGATLASAGSKSNPSAPPTVTQPAVGQSAADGDQVQQGDQSAPDTTASDQAAESGTEQLEASSAESGSEQVANDGPGGHADEPGNASADHQFQGQE